MKIKVRFFAYLRDLNPNLVVFKKGTSVQSLKDLETELNEGDTINIFPFIGGG